MLTKPHSTTRCYKTLALKTHKHKHKDFRQSKDYVTPVQKPDGKSQMFLITKADTNK